MDITFEDRLISQTREAEVYRKGGWHQTDWMMGMHQGRRSDGAGGEPFYRTWCSPGNPFGREDQYVGFARYKIV